ncbi:YuzF family protein [Paenibacillus koleovorans]|uniref:YuzF family protein n=1 Tax=Paenibacillus koleovorans TaxID=121608 RepID=UPI000FDA608F|nr:YuzF family protein [Paenibacillus koleovorans]
MNNASSPQTQTVFQWDPYVVQTLQGVLGRQIVVETVRGIVRGQLKEVKPDHIVVHQPSGDSTFYVRIQQIIWVMPE